MFQHGSYLRRTRGGSTDVQSKAHCVKRVDAVDTESTRCSSKHVLKKSLSNTLDGRHVAERGSTDRHRTATTFRDRRHYAVIQFSSDGRDLSRPFRRTWSHHDRWIAIGRCKQVVEELHDRGPIEPQLSRDRTSFIAELIHVRQTTFSGESRARSTPDRGLIVARSWSIMAKIVASFEANLKQNRG